MSPSLHGILQQLQHYQPLPEILNHLKTFQGLTFFSPLFQTLFPRDAAQLLPTWFPHTFLQPSSPCTRLLEHFFALINHHHFPLNNDWALEVAHDGDCNYIPIDPQFGYDDETDWEHYSPSEQLFGLLSGYIDPTDWERISTLFTCTLPTPILHTYLDFRQFTHRCHQRGPILRALPAALTAFSHQTNTIWWDFVPQWGHESYFQWDLPTIQALARQWRAAQCFHQTTTRILSHLNTHHKDWIRTLTDWNASQGPTIHHSNTTLATSTML